MFSIDYIKEWSESYKTDLTTNIMPFWAEIRAGQGQWRYLYLR